MWEQLLDIVKKVAFLTQDTQKNKADIKELQGQMEEMAETIRRMAHEIQRDRENQAHEREKLLLRLEVALLRSEQRRVSGRVEADLLLEGDDQPPPKA